MTPDQELMAKIKTECGPSIEEAIEGTPFPAALLAALTANESGGDYRVTRFETAILADLSLTLIGRRASFGSIGGQDLEAYLRIGPPGPVEWTRTLVDLATSWGPMQIMGYQALAGHYPLADLPTIDKHFHHAVTMLEDFRKRFELEAVDPATRDWMLFFHCWNAGAPRAATFDPHYSVRALDRMMIYINL